MALKQFVAASLAALLVTTPVLAASGDAIRSANTNVSTAMPIGAAKVVRAGMRVGGPVRAENNLLGAPLLLALVGAASVTIGTLVITNVVNNNSNSPG